MTSTHGGARAGAGRKRLRLADLLLEGSFRWDNKRHRRALLEDDGPLELGDSAWAREVEQVVGWYRQWPYRPQSAYFARRLEYLVTGGGR